MARELLKNRGLGIFVKI